MRERKGERQTDRQTDRHTDRHTDTQTETEIETETERQREFLVLNVPSIAHGHHGMKPVHKTLPATTELIRRDCPDLSQSVQSLSGPCSSGVKPAAMKITALIFSAVLQVAALLFTFTSKITALFVCLFVLSLSSFFFLLVFLLHVAPFLKLPHSCLHLHLTA